MSSFFFFSFPFSSQNISFSSLLRDQIRSPRRSQTQRKNPRFIRNSPPLDLKGQGGRGRRPSTREINEEHYFFTVIFKDPAARELAMNESLHPKAESRSVRALTARLA